MSDVKLAGLPDRGVLRIDGEDRVAFLQGLVSNDVSRVGADRAIYAALLTPQGKFLHDFFIAAIGDSLLIDCEGDRRDDLFRRLRLYRLRSKVELTDVTEELAVHAAFGKGAAGLAGENPSAGQAMPNGEGVSFVDPRLAGAGLRYILPAGTSPETGDLPVSAATADDYDRWRLSLGLPDGSRDMVVEKAILLESGFEALNGVDFDKGCYMGQELTARTKYRGLVKKRLMPVRIAGDLPEPGTAIMAGDRDVGEIRSGRGDLAMALVRLDALEAGELTAAGLKVTPAAS
ncbi:folate-binding protein [Alphaproteobacteria bacterium HT1-32]|nr:folate-binding protein [Alphaproteobacteria bacterium HT1-32]